MQPAPDVSLARFGAHRSSRSDIRLLPRHGPTVAARPRRGACRAGDAHHRGLQIVAHSRVCRGTDGEELSVGFALLGSTVAGVSTRLFAALSRLANVTQSGPPTARTRRSRLKFRRHQRSCQLSRLQPGGEAVRTPSAGRPSQPLVARRVQTVPLGTTSESGTGHWWSKFSSATKRQWPADCRS